MSSKLSIGDLVLVVGENINTDPFMPQKGDICIVTFVEEPGGKDWFKYPQSGAYYPTTEYNYRIRSPRGHTSWTVGSNNLEVILAQG